MYILSDLESEMDYSISGFTISGTSVSDISGKLFEGEATDLRLEGSTGTLTVTGGFSGSVTVSSPSDAFKVTSDSIVQTSDELDNCCVFQWNSVTSDFQEIESRCDAGFTCVLTADVNDDHPSGYENQKIEKECRAI